MTEDNNITSRQNNILNVLRLVFVLLNVPLSLLVNGLFSIDELRIVSNPLPISLYGRELSNPYVAFLSWIWRNSELALYISLGLAFVILVTAGCMLALRNLREANNRYKHTLGLIFELLVITAVVSSHLLFINTNVNCCGIVYILFGACIAAIILSILLIPVGDSSVVGNWEIWVLLLIDIVFVAAYLSMAMPVDFAIADVMNIVGFRLVYLGLPILLLVALLPGVDRLSQRYTNSQLVSVLNLCLPVLTITAIIIMFGSVYHYSFANRLFEPIEVAKQKLVSSKSFQVLKVNPDGSCSSEKINYDLLAINNIAVQDIAELKLTPALKQAQALLYLQSPLDTSDFDYLKTITQLNSNPTFDLAFISHKPVVEDTSTIEHIFRVQSRLREYRSLLPKRLISNITIDPILNLDYNPEHCGTIRIYVVDEEDIPLPDFIVGIRRTGEVIPADSSTSLPAINFCVISASGNAEFQNVPKGEYEAFLVTEPTVHPLLELYDINVSTDPLVVKDSTIHRLVFELTPKQAT